MKLKNMFLIALFLVIFLLIIYHVYDSSNIKIVENNENYNKIIVTMTTIPERINKGTIKKTLDSLSKQTVKPDVIYINISKKTKKGEDYPIDKLNELIKEYNNNNIILNIVEKDLGPITKIVPTLSFIKENDYVIIVDDDVTYSSNMIESLINTKKDAVGYVGRINMEFKTSEYYSGPVDFLETYASVLYRGKNLIGLDTFIAGLDNMCQNQDDIVIGKFLNNKGIKPMIDSSLKGNKIGNHDAEGTAELRINNVDGNENEKCYYSLFQKGENV